MLFLLGFYVGMFKRKNMIPIQTPKQKAALKFFPSSISIASAQQQLRREIMGTKGLREKMSKNGSVKGHNYNKRQMDILLEHFGITVEEYENC